MLYTRDSRYLGRPFPKGPALRIDIKDRQGKPLFTVHVDPKRPPTVVKAEDGRGSPVSLNWDRALDDAGLLRHCPVCGCADLYRRKRLPRLMVVALVLALTATAMRWYGAQLQQWLPVAVVAVLMVAADIGVWRFVKPMMVCYRCRAEYRDAVIPNGVGRWEAGVAERYRASPD